MSRPRAQAVVAVLATLVLTLLAGIPAGPAGADAGADAGAEPDLAVRLAGLTPAVASGPGDVVRLSGSVVNTGDGGWTEATVSLVTRPTPYFASDGLSGAVDDPGAETVGRPVAATGASASIGTVAAGQSRPFTLQVRYEDLGLDGQAGVYPLGAEVVATDPTGERSERAVDGAFTFLPLVGTTASPVAVSLVVPFTAPVRRTTRGRYTDADELLAQVADGGAMRRLLDLTRASVAAGTEAAAATTVLLDPALLDALDDLASGRTGPGRPTASTAPTASGTEPAPDEGDDDAAGSPVARAFLDDLLALARAQPTWALGYGQPDVQGLLDAGQDEREPALAREAREASTATLARFDLEARPVGWPPNGIASAAAVRAGRGTGDLTTVLSPRVLPGWERTDGSVLRAGGGPDRRVVVRDPQLLRGGSDRDSALSVRQRILAEASLAAIDDDPVRQVVAVLGPGFDPGPESAGAAFEQVLAPTWAVAGSPDGEPVAWTDGVRVPARLTPTPIREAQVTAAGSVALGGRRLGEITDDAALTSYYRESAALAVAQVWRQDPAEGVERARSLARGVTGRLAEVRVETTPVLTLSGTSGQLPLSVTNDLDRPVTVGLRIRSSGAVQVPDVAPFELQPGQRQTVRVEVDVGETTNTAMTAQLVTERGAAFGDAARFNVRSSLVGRTVWVVLGGAAALLLLALGRRFATRRPGRDGTT